MGTSAFDHLWESAGRTTGPVYDKNGHPVVDTSALDGSGHVPTHRLDQPTNRQPDESWTDYEARVLARKSFSPDTAATSSLSALNPDVADSTRSLLAHAQRDGVPLNIAETRRSQERQEMLFQKGRSAPGDVATWTLTSDHTPGRAVDFAGDPSALQWLQANAPQHGFSVMGNMDPGHVSLPTGATRAPVRPVAAPAPARPSFMAEAPPVMPGRQPYYASEPPVLPSRQPYYAAEPPTLPTHQPAATPRSVAPASAAPVNVPRPATAVASVSRTVPAPAAPRGDLLDSLWDQAPAAADDSRRSGLYNAVNTLDNAMTFGLGQKLNAAWEAADAALHNRDSFGHAYNQSLDAQHAGISQLRQAHPYGSAALSAAGTIPMALVAGPLAAARTAGANLLATGAEEAPIATSMLARAGQAAKAGAKGGAALGAVDALGNAPNRGGLLETIGTGLKGAALGGGTGALLAGGSVPASEVIAQAAERLRGSPVLAKMTGASALPVTIDATPTAARIAGRSVPRPPQVGHDDALLLQRLQRSGLTPQDALDRLEQIPTDKPVTVMEVAGQTSQPVRELGKWVARQPSTGQAQILAAIDARKNPLQSAQRVLGDVADVMGVDRQNLIDHGASLKAQQVANAKPFYDASVNNPDTPHVPFDFQASEDGPTLADLLKRPSIRSAVKFHNDIAAERGESPMSLPMTEPAAPAAPVSIRDGQGRLRADLTKVPDEELDAEWQRLAELNSKERAMHEGVRDANYREDYESLPSTEKYGHSGREDLPDADGAVDPERLLADNKIVSDYNRSAIVRKARQRAMDRIQAETNRRPAPGADTDFNFGANVSSSSSVPPIPDNLKSMFSPEQWADVVRKSGYVAPPGAPTSGVADEAAAGGVPLKTLQQLKFKLDDMLGFAKRNGQLPDGTPATKAKLGAVNDTRLALLDLMTSHSENYAKGNASWAGDAALQDQLEAGKAFTTRDFSELSHEYPNLTPGEQQQHNVAAVSKPLRDKIYGSNAIDRANLLRSADMQERLGVVQRPENVPAFNRNLDIEHQIALTNQQVPGGSDTKANFSNDADVAAVTPVKSAITGILSGRPRRALTAGVRGLVSPALDRFVQGMDEQTANALAPKLAAGMLSRDDLVKMLYELANQHALLKNGLPVPAIAGRAAGYTGGLLPGRNY